MAQKRINQRLNSLKTLACILVVFNHIRFPGRLGEIVYTISHLGVPIFFLTSGYYLYDEAQRELKPVIPKLRHIAELLALHILLYVFHYVFWAHMDGLKRDYVLSILAQVFSWNRFFNQSVLWSESVFGDGQWFIIALLEGYLFFYLVRRLHVQKHIVKFSVPIAVALFLVHIPVRMLLLNQGIEGIGTQSLYATASVRNAWFDAIPFMLVGIGIHASNRTAAKIPGGGILQPRDAVIAIAAVAISVIEADILKNNALYSKMNCVLYLGTIVASVKLFAISVKYPSSKENILSRIGSSLSMFVFFFHTITARWINYILDSFGIHNDTWYPYVHPLVTVVLTVLLSMCVYTLIKSLQLGQRVRKVDIAVIIVFMILLLPGASLKWNLSGKVFLDRELIQMDMKVDSISKQNEIMVTAQNSEAETVASTAVTTPQFINGAAWLSYTDAGKRYEVRCAYVDDETVRVVADIPENGDGKIQIRVWMR